MLTVIGEALIDMVGDREDRATYRALPGGSPLNVAIGTARLGCDTTLMARLSDDAFGRALRGHAEANGVRLALHDPALEPSTLAIASVGADGVATYAFYIEGTADWQWTPDELRRVPTDSTLVHTGSLASWIAPGATLIAEALRLRRAGGQSLLSYDPNVRPGLLPGPDAARELVEPYLRIAHLVKASDADLAWLYPGRDPLESLRAWSAVGPDLVVLTRGGDGAVAMTADGAVVERPARPTAVVDTVGAGDAFMAGLLCALTARALNRADGLSAIAGDTAAVLLDEAGTVASLTCARPGADPPTAAELAAALGAG